MSENILLRSPPRISDKEVKENPELPNRNQMKQSNLVNSSVTSSDDEPTMAPLLIAAANGNWKVFEKMIAFLEKTYDQYPNDAYDHNNVLQNHFAIRTNGSKKNVLHLILNRPDSILTNSENPPELEIQVRTVLTMLPSYTRNRSYKTNKYL